VPDGFSLATPPHLRLPDKEGQSKIPLIRRNFTLTPNSVRHPNYLGEIMIYGSFAMMVWHWLPVVVLAWVWLGLGLFAVNMTIKEASMSRYPEWASYKKRTWWLIPFVL